MSDSQEKYVWIKSGTNTVVTKNPHRGYSGSIVYTTVYTLTITGSGAPAAAPYPTLRLAKNAYRKFLNTKPVGS